jgi:hypothetical protein
MAKAKDMSIMEMFSGFPSFMARGEAEIAMSCAAYLEILAKFSERIVADACLSFRKRATAWPPTSGEVFAKCEDYAAREAEAVRFTGRPVLVEQYSDEHREAMKARFTKLVDDLKHGRLPPPRHGFTDEQLADPNCIVNRKGQTPYTLRPGPPFGFNDVHAPYGFLTPKELSAPSVVVPIKRTKPPSWAEKQDRRSHLRVVRDDGF